MYFCLLQISQRVFEIMRTECLGDTLAIMGVIKTSKDFSKVHTGNENNRSDKIRSIPFESYKKRTTVIVKRRRFIDVVCDALAEYKYVGPNQRADSVLACRYFCLSIYLDNYEHKHALVIVIFFRLSFSFK